MRRLPYAVLTAVVFLLDRFTKQLVVQRLPLHDEIPIAPFFSLVHVRNTGAAFGIFSGANTAFIVLTVIVLGALTIYRRSWLGSGPVALAGLALLWGGALGNLVDRVTLGSVTDFLDFYWRGWHWPAFNVADAAICVGVGLMVIDGLLARREAAN